MKAKFFFTLLLLLPTCVYCQDNKIVNEQIDILKKIQGAFNTRKVFLLEKTPKDYEESYNTLKSCDSLINFLKNENSDKIDFVYIGKVSERISKELETKKEDITQMSKGKTEIIKVASKYYKLTDKEVTYLTYLSLIWYDLKDHILQLYTKLN